MWLVDKILGSGKAVDKLVDGVYNGIDAAIFTPQEKVEMRLKFLSHYEPFKIAQRLLSCIFAIPYALGWISVLVASYMDIDTTKQEILLNGTMGNIVLAIVGFYFLGGSLSSLKKN